MERIPSHLMLPVRLGYPTDTPAQPAFSLVTELSKMLAALRARLADWLGGPSVPWNLSPPLPSP